MSADESGALVWAGSPDVAITARISTPSAVIVLTPRILTAAHVHGGPAKPDATPTGPAKAGHYTDLGRRESPRRSLGPQRLHRIDAGRAPRGDGAGNECRKRQRHQRRRERARIVGLD